MRYTNIIKHNATCVAWQFLGEGTDCPREIRERITITEIPTPFGKAIPVCLYYSGYPLMATFGDWILYYENTEMQHMSSQTFITMQTTLPILKPCDP